MKGDRAQGSNRADEGATNEEVGKGLDLFNDETSSPVRRHISRF
jgi:hypothetical protein